MGSPCPSGTFLDTGVAGLTLSGGISYLVASEGFACDALVGAELVTADGTIVEVDEEREPDLLWALRGGGGNFGVVTRLRYRMAAVARMYGGLLRYRGDGVEDALRRLFELERGRSRRARPRGRGGALGRLGRAGHDGDHRLARGRGLR